MHNPLVHKDCWVGHFPNRAWHKLELRLLDLNNLARLLCRSQMAV
jgi:hypothetical protein